jgi:hypothetical protein
MPYDYDLWMTMSSEWMLLTHFYTKICPCYSSKQRVYIICRYCIIVVCMYICMYVHTDMSIWYGEWGHDDLYLYINGYKIQTVIRLLGLGLLGVYRFGEHNIETQQNKCRKQLKVLQCSSSYCNIRLLSITHFIWSKDFMSERYYYV